MVEAPKPASQRKKITPNNGVPSYFWYLLKSCGFIQNRHIIIESEAATNVQYSPSLRNNQFFPVLLRLFFVQNKTPQKSSENPVFQFPFFLKKSRLQKNNAKLTPSQFGRLSNRPKKLAKPPISH